MSLVKIFIIIGIFLVSEVYSQDKKAFKEIFMDAEYFFLSEEYEEAIFLYSELLKNDSTNSNLHFLIGASYLSIYGKKEKAISYLERAVLDMTNSYREGSYKERKAPRYALFGLANAYHINNEFDEAIKYYNKYKDIMVMRNFAEIDFVNKQIESCEYAKQMVLKPDTINFRDIGDVINYSMSNYNPVISGNNSILIYMANRPFYAAIMMSENVNGEWTEPKVLNAQLGSDGDCYATSISYDGKELYLVKKDYYNSDIYVSYFKRRKWSKIQKLDNNINTNYYESHACISKDNKTLYFTSNRKGGEGAMDIYKSKRDKNNKWGPAVNLGPTINTLYSEETPFVTENDEMLFFSSQGYMTMGGFDIFYSTKLSNDEWSLPVNMGYPINSSDDDLFFVPVNNGMYAYYSAVFDEVNRRRSIYSLKLFSEKKLNEVAFRGVISLSDNVEILDKSINLSIIDSEKEDTIAIIHPDAPTGEFKYNLKPGPYKINIDCDGYASKSVNINIIPDYLQSGIYFEAELKPEEVSSGEYIIVKNIMFDFDSYTLNNDDILEVERLYQVMNQYPEIYVEVIGHTDAIGPAEYNLKLSKKRARSVTDFLMSKGISVERFVSKGVGETESIAVNLNPDGTDSPEGRKLNRHVDIKLINPENKDVMVQEIFVPDHLRPKYDLNFSVLLVNSKENITNLPKKISGEVIKLIETDMAYLYTAGNFSRKEDAVKLLNFVIDNEYPDAHIIEDKKLEELIKSLSEIKELTTGTYTIQLMALRRPVDISYFKTLKGVKKYAGQDGYYRYVYGEFESLEMAKKERQDIIEMGYNDVFIMNLRRYKELSDEIDENLTKELQDQLMIYTIQFSASKKTINKSKYKNLSDIKITKGKDGYFRYTTGAYQNRYDAVKALGKIKKMGYQDAFIRIIRSL